MLESFRNRKPRSAEALAKQGTKEKARWLDPEYRAKQSASRKSAWASLSAEARAARLGPMLETLTPEKRASNSRLAATPEARQKKSRTFKSLWANQEWREKQLVRQEAGRLRMDRRTMGQHISAAWTPERRAAQAERMSKLRQRQILEAQRAQRLLFT
jgi:hypothetical protein